MESTMTLRQWTAADVIGLEPCYDADCLRLLFDRPMTLPEALARTDGAWADVSDDDRVWFGARAMGKRARLHFAADCAERALARVADPDPRSVAVVPVIRAYADGLATEAEMDAARRAAWFASASAWLAADADADASASAWSAAAAAAAGEATVSAAAARAAADAARAEAMAEYGAARADRAVHVADIIRFAERYGDE